MTEEQIEQLAQGMRFAGLTEGQSAALDKIVGELGRVQDAATPLLALVERFEAYCRANADVPRRSRMDFTAWLEQRGEDPDVLLGQFRALNTKGEQPE